MVCSERELRQRLSRLHQEGGLKHECRNTATPMRDIDCCREASWHEQPGQRWQTISVKAVLAFLAGKLPISLQCEYSTKLPFISQPTLPCASSKVSQGPGNPVAAGPPVRFAWPDTMDWPAAMLCLRYTHLQAYFVLAAAGSGWWIPGMTR